MGRIIWLASYPKSGNTWVRALLTNFRGKGDAAADINELEGGPHAAARMWFDEWTGIEASALSDALIRRLRPDVYRCLARQTEETLFMKVHDAWALTEHRQPLFPPDVTAGVIYIVRNPLDLVASYAHHSGITLHKSAEQLCDSAHSIGRSARAPSDHLPQHLGSWSDHVRSWLDQSGLRIHVVRYEDLRRDTVEAFEAILRFCGIAVEEMKVGKAVTFSEFAELQQQERAHGFRERHQGSTAAFFRRGEAGSWRQELPGELARQIINEHGDTMRRFGYFDEPGLNW